MARGPPLTQILLLLLSLVSRQFIVPRSSGNPPILSSLNLASGAVGTSVTLTGANFGTTQGTSTVTFNGTAVTQVEFWHPASIVVLVPSGAATGNVVVTVGGLGSNPISYTVNAATYYYVDANRTSNGTGTAANPWKAKTDVNWTTVTTQLASTDVVIYWSSRARWNDANQVTLVSGSSSHRLTVDGKSYYNSVASGTASWQSETSGWPAVGASKSTWQTMYQHGTTNAPTGCATFGSTTTRSGGIYFPVSSSYVTLRGFCMDNPNFGITFGAGGHNEQNMHDYLVEFNVVDTPGQQGIYGGGATVGCHDWWVSHNGVFDTNGEAEYMGQFDFYAGSTDNTGNGYNQCTNPGPCADSLTGFVVEFNTNIDTGSGGGEGDIDIKPGDYGAIVRYNVSNTGGTGHVQAGNTVFASNVQVYGNWYSGLQPAAPAENGDCIYVTSAGASAGLPTHAIVGLTIYNNVCNGTYRGINFDTQADISGVILENNVLSGATNGPAVAITGPAVVTFTRLENNIFSQNNTTEISAASSTVFTAAPDYNLLYHPAASSQTAQVGGVNKSWAQWQALGGSTYDAHGVNADPQLDGTYHVPTSSPAYKAGATLTDFSVDRAGIKRSTPWWIGAYQ